MDYTLRYLAESGESLTFSTNSKIIIIDFPLLTGLLIEAATSQSVSQIGGTLDSMAVAPSVSIISGIIMGDAKAAKESLLATILPLRKGKLIINDKYFIDVVPTQTPILSRDNEFANFQFSVKAPYPFWQSVNSTITPLSGLVGAFKFPWNLTRKYKFGTLLSSFFTNIYNAGQAESNYTLEIAATGTAVNPRIENVATGEFLLLNKSLTAGENITIDIGIDRIEAFSSVTGVIDGLIDIDSSLFAIHTGDNIIKYSADSGREYLNVLIKFNNKFAGLVV